MTRLRVLISGAGIAGNALAFWLSKLGHEVTVVERFPSLRATGLQVDLRGHGIEVMRRMGLEQNFRANCAPEQGLQVVNSSGTRRAYFPANTSGAGAQSFTTDYEIMRGDFCRLIYDASKDRAKYMFGVSVESFDDHDGSVAVKFTDGEVDKYDLLVGADGSGSRIRKLMLGPKAVDAFTPIENGGLYVAYFTIPRPIQEGEQYIATIYTATGSRGVMTRRHNPHEIQVYLGCKTNSEHLKNVHRGDVEQQKEALAEIFRGAGWQMDDIVAALPNAKEFYFERLGLVKLDPWSRGRVVLVGDAAYCPSANTGMGTTSGIVAAYILAGEIGRHCAGPVEENTCIAKGSLAAALEAYEQKFRPFMDQVQKGVAEGSGWSMPSAAFGITMMNCLLGILSLLRVNVGKMFLKEDVKGWDLPEYEELRFI